MVGTKLGMALKCFAVCGAFAMMVGCGGPSKTDRALAEKDRYITQQEDRISQLEAEKQRKAQELATAQEINQKQLEQNRQIAKNLGEANAQQAAMLNSLNAQVADLKKSLGDQEKSGNVTLVPSDKLGTITIRVANTVLFDSGKAQLKSSGMETLAKVAETLKAKYPENFIRVEGHTDSTPIVRNKHIFPDNMALSQARSKAVYDHLVKSHGMPANRMYTAGYSYYQPLVWPEKSTADKAKNRRVDIVILPNIPVNKKRDPVAQR